MFMFGSLMECEEHECVEHERMFVNSMAEAEWANIEEKLSNHKLSKVETLTPGGVDRMKSTPARVIKPLKEESPQVLIDKQYTLDTLTEQTDKVPGSNAEYWQEMFVHYRSRVLSPSNSLTTGQPKKKTFFLPCLLLVNLLSRFFLRGENTGSDRPKVNKKNKPALRERLYNVTGAWFFAKGFNNKREQSAQEAHDLGCC